MVGAEEAVRFAAGLVGPGAVATREGAGWDHVAWRVVGRDGRPWIVRWGIDGDADELATEVRREVAVMRAAREVLGDLVGAAVVLDDARGCLAHPWVPGTPLQALLVADRVPAPERSRLAREIGAIVATIARVPPPPEVEVDEGLPAWLAATPPFVDVIDHLLSDRERAAIARFLATPPPAGPPPDALPLTHNDLGAEHVLVDPGSLAITGILDWSDAARADPAAELGRLLRDLGADLLDDVLDGMGVGDADRADVTARAWCYARCLVLEDVAYAVERRPDLLAFERASLAALFAAV
jgi:aminoglycoside phosphotransferase (APT) family kinase protein